MHSEAFMTLKGNKMKFVSKMAARLLNPAKPQLRKIIKVKLQRINSEIRTITKLNQLQLTKDTIKWFNGLKHKTQRHFSTFDFLSFYLRITEKNLKNSFSCTANFFMVKSIDFFYVFFLTIAPV